MTNKAAVFSTDTVTDKCVLVADYSYYTDTTLIEILQLNAFTQMIVV